MRREQIDFAFLNVGHFLDHLFMLIFATVAALTTSLPETPGADNQCTRLQQSFLWMQLNLQRSPQSHGRYLSLEAKRSRHM